MTAVATAIVGSAIIGGIASNRAASKQAKAAQKGIDAQNKLLGPYSDAGAAGLGDVQAFVDSGSEENFRDTQAFKDIINSSKSTGFYNGSRRYTALGDYLMTNYRPQRLNELMQLPTLGANASAGQATNLGNLYQAQGNAQANGIYGAGLAAQNALGSFAYLQNFKGSNLSSNPSMAGQPVQPGQAGYGGYT